MSWILLMPALALAFSSGPSKSCTSDSGCVLVRETTCGTLHAVALGQDQRWADWEAKDQQRAKREKRVCPEGPRPDAREYEARCERGQCVAVKKGG